MTKNNIRKIIFFSIIILALVLVLIGPIIWENEFNKDLKVIFLDVGQGDAILIKTPNKQNILIDGGPNNKVLYGLGKNIPFYKRKIDLMILTHSDFDHITGLIEVLKRYQVNLIYYNGLEDDSLEFQEWFKIIKDKNINLQITRSGDEMKLGNDLALKTIYPFIVTKDLANNNTSLVNKLIYKKTSFLFTGDLEMEGENDLLIKKEDLKSNVLKVGHHGGKKSTTADFLRAVSPEYGIISVGKDNRFGHPTFRVLKNLQNIRAKILRTDIDGEIKITTNGESLIY